MSEPLRRMEIRLPVNHPVWNLPNRSRGKIVREWLELGRRLTEIEKSLNDITDKLNSGSMIINKNNEKVEVQEDINTQLKFDKNAFLSHFK